MMAVFSARFAALVSAVLLLVLMLPAVHALNISIAALPQPATILKNNTAGTWTFVLTRDDTSASDIINVDLTGTAAITTHYDLQAAAGTSVSGNVLTYTLGASGPATLAATFSPIANALVVQGDVVATATIQTSGAYEVVAGAGSASYTIIDVDFNDVSVAVSPSEQLENVAVGTPFVFTFTRGGDNTLALNVSFVVSGTSLFGQDYTQTGAVLFSTTSGVVTIPAASNTAQVSLSTIDNAIGESNKTVVLTVFAGPRYIVTSPSSATAIIINDDSDSVEIAVSPAAVNMHGATPLTFTATRYGTLSNGNLTVALSFAGTAVLNTDFNVTSGLADPLAPLLFFPTGVATASFTAMPIASLVRTADKAVNASLAATTPGWSYTLRSASFALGTITNDNTDVSVVVVAPDSVLHNSGLTLNFTFTRSGDLLKVLTVSFNISGTASPSTDYTQSGATSFSTSTRIGTVDFPINASSVTVVITPVSTTRVVPDRTVTFTVLTGAASSAATLYAPDVSLGSATATILVDNTNTVTLSVSPSSISSTSSSPAAYTFLRGGDTSSAITVGFSVGGSAVYQTSYITTGAATFSSGSGTVVISAGSTSAVVFVAPIVDNTFKPNSTVFLTLVPGSLYVVGSISPIELTIGGNSQGLDTISISTSTTVLFEDDPSTSAVVTFFRNGGNQGSPLTVQFGVQGAIFNVDFTAAGQTTMSSSVGSITFAANSATASLVVSPIDNKVTAPSLFLKLTLQSSSIGVSYAVNPSSNQATIEIVLNSQLTVDNIDPPESSTSSFSLVILKVPSQQGGFEYSLAQYRVDISYFLGYPSRYIDVVAPNLKNVAVKLLQQPLGVRADSVATQFVVALSTTYANSTVNSRRRSPVSPADNFVTLRGATGYLVDPTFLSEPTTPAFLNPTPITTFTPVKVGPGQGKERYLYNYVITPPEVNSANSKALSAIAVLMAAVLLLV